MTQGFSSFHESTEFYDGACHDVKDRLRTITHEADDADHFLALACEFMRQIIMVNDDLLVMALARVVTSDFPTLEPSHNLLLTHYLGHELTDPIR